jgi:hypothetical protein
VNRQERLDVLNHRMFFDHFVVELYNGVLVSYGPRTAYTEVLHAAEKKKRDPSFEYGVVTIAAIACEAPEGGKLTTYYGLSFCAPGDNFSRERGCLKAKRALHAGLHCGGKEDWKYITNHPQGKRQLYSGNVTNECLPLKTMSRTEWLRYVLRQFSIEARNPTSTKKEMPHWYGRGLLYAAQEIIFVGPDAYTLVGQLVEVFEKRWKPLEEKPSQG